MRGRLAISLVLTVALAGALLGPANLAGAAPKTVVVGTDPDDDWGANVDPEIAPAGGALGQELVEASIGMADKKTVNFVMTVTMLPPTGGAPEVTRYTWDFNVDGEFTELDGKFTNYSRGVCDPTSGQCPPPRDPGMQPFFVRGNCATDATTNVTLCEELGTVQAVFDAAEGTITVPVPLELIGAKKGSKIAPDANIFGGSISATPSAFFTSSAMPIDTLTVTKTFGVPKK